MTVNWIEPKHTKSQVKAAGKRIRTGIEEQEDVEILENWRASHSYILNTFQSTLRGRSKQQEITVAQRLKRRNTIYDKLKREPNMQLSTMHDIAGCRVIFPDEAHLVKFRNLLHKSRFKHKLRSDDSEKYNYIEHPKASGYRGIHDVYEYNVSSQGGIKWNGLLIEIQYRTKYQHAWATAVELADLITYNRIKFSQSDEDHAYFFQLASEIIARFKEQRNSCLPDLSNKCLVDEFKMLDRKLGLLNTFQKLKTSNINFRAKRNTLLIFKLNAPQEEDVLQVISFDSINEAIKEYQKLEKSSDIEVDIVLVKADSADNIREAFRNYFKDAHEFVQYMSNGCKKLIVR